MKLRHQAPRGSRVKGRGYYHAYHDHKIRGGSLYGWATHYCQSHNFWYTAGLDPELPTEIGPYIFGNDPSETAGIDLTSKFEGISLKAAIRKIRKSNPPKGAIIRIWGNPSSWKGGKSRAQKMINFDYLYIHK